MALLLNWTVTPNLMNVCLLLSHKTHNHFYKGQQVEKKHTLFVQDVYKMPQNIGNDFVSSRRFFLMPAYTSAEPRNVWDRVAGRGGRLHDMDLATPRAWAQPGGLPQLHLF